MDDVLQRPTCQFREACSVIISFILTTLGFVFVVIESKPARGYVGKNLFCVVFSLDQSCQ